MKISNFFVSSLKEIDKEIILPSHRLLLKAGFIEKIESGLYSYLPLGLRVIEKIKKVIQTEMENVAASETLFPLLIGKKFFAQSNRWEVFEKELFRLQDRHDKEYGLAPTHEEVFALLVKKRISSYKQLPLTLYQIGTKFRDEIRPRYGLMRAREFVMKDAYSFHLEEQSLEKTYQQMKQAYKKIFQKLSLDFLVMDADSGAIGGNTSEEFIIKTENGESEVLTCADCKHSISMEMIKDKMVENIKENDPCPNCPSGKMQLSRGIEIGHIFQLGDKYTKALDVVVLDKEGNKKILTMGCYGIGVSRLLAAIVECSHDEDGMIFPEEVAPFKVHLITLDEDENLIAKAQEIYDTLKNNGIEILWDDRKERAGFKFKEADLIGIPYQIVLGKKNLDKGLGTIKNRKTREKKEMGYDEIVDFFKKGMG